MSVASHIKRHLLPATVFITGACVLVIEVVAVRVLSPYFGSTIFTVSSVISVILLALSVGYYYGGKLADQQPKLSWFFSLILISGLTVLGLHFLGIMLLPWLSSNLSLTSGPLLSAGLLFLPSALVLGTLSPYAVKLESLSAPEAGIGAVAGKMFFFSTLGSISGSLLAGFVLIPHVGINAIFIGTGVALFMLGAVPLLYVIPNKARVFDATMVLVILLTACWFAVDFSSSDTAYSYDGVYSRITVEDSTYEDRPVRFFRQDLSNASAMFLDTDDATDLVYDYTKYYALHDVFTPKVDNALVIGGGIYSVPRALLAELPEANVDVSEVEPSLYELAKERFNLQDDARLHNFTEDGRRLLEETDKNYDLIFSDVYHSIYSIPPHFTTKEFFELARSKMTDGGLFVANFIGDLNSQTPSLIHSSVKTFRSVFPNSYIFAVQSSQWPGAQNFIFVGHNTSEVIDLKSSQIVEHSNPIIRALSDHEVRISKADLSEHVLLTDDYSPVEYYTSKVLRRAFR